MKLLYLFQMVVFLEQFRHIYKQKFFQNSVLYIQLDLIYDKYTYFNHSIFVKNICSQFDGKNVIYKCCRY